MSSFILICPDLSGSLYVMDAYMKQVPVLALKMPVLILTLSCTQPVNLDHNLTDPHIDMKSGSGPVRSSKKNSDSLEQRKKLY